MKSPYRIREILEWTNDEDETLVKLHRLCFAVDEAAVPDRSKGFWWFVYFEGDEVGFAGMDVGRTPGTGYLVRAGILPEHRGRGLQKRLIRVRERKAKSVGWNRLASDTNDLASANSLIRCGFKLFKPKNPWGVKNSLYLEKFIDPGRTPANTAAPATSGLELPGQLPVIHQDDGPTNHS